MKKRKGVIFYLFAGLLFLLASFSYSQSGKVPPFKMIQANGDVFLAGNLPIGNPIVIIYFSPDCHDCNLLIEGLLNRINDFSKASLVLITYLSVETVDQFVNKYNLNKYQNIFVGTEVNSLFVRNYYNILKFPFSALYNKDGDLIKSYSEVNLDDISARLKKLEPYNIPKTLNQ